MRFRWGRIIIAAVAAEIGAIAALIALVAIFGPHDMAGDQRFAERLGLWVGPIAGAIMCFIGGFWVARSAGSRRIMHGLLVGLAAALIDISLLIGMKAGFQFLFLASDLGKVLAGALGGWAAARRGGGASGDERGGSPGFITAKPMICQVCSGRGCHVHHQPLNQPIKRPKGTGTHSFR